jgi:aldehyde:ferredoxin oxidoreductase
MLNFSFYDRHRKVTRVKQAGRGGLGTIFRDKHIRALVIKFQGVKGNLNNPADISTVNRLGVKMHKEIHDLDDR